ncbi:MAG: hypothetical protein ACXVEF_23650 [Polyangiales bacterium]
MKKLAIAGLVILGCSTSPKQRSESKPSPVFAIAPQSLTSPIRIERRDVGFAFEVTGLGLADVAGIRSDRTVRYDGASPGMDVLLVDDERGFEELRVLHDEGANVAMRWQVARAPNLAALDLRAGGIDVIATDGHVVMRMQPMFSVDAKGVRRDLAAHLASNATGWEISTDPLPSDVAYPVTIDPLWTLAAGAMSTVRLDAQAVDLADGKVLVIGGSGTTTEAFDPVTSTWSPRASTKSVHGANARAVRLPGGKVFLLDSSPEVYDPATDTWSTTPVYTGPTDRVVALPDGRAFMVGNSTQAAFYDPSTNSFKGVTPVTAHMFPALAVLGSGKVLIAGGMTLSAELFDPVAETSSPTGSLSAPTDNAVASVLPSGKVLVVGGEASLKAMLYDPAAGTFADIGAPSGMRRDPAAIRLFDGALLLAGGDGAAIALSTVEMFDPVSSSWLSAGPMVSPRWHHTGAPLPGGRALVAGGSSPPPTPGSYSTAEIFARFPTASACSSGALCASGFCVDGVCCDKACTGACEACNVTPGTCSAVTGAPHGKRTCTGFTCAAGACLTSCAMDAQCIAADYCDGGACKPKKADGEACTRGPECATNDCVKGTCGISCTDDAKCGGSTYCDGTRCTKRLSNGTACERAPMCLTAFCIDGFCCSDNRSCAPYVCGDTGCKTSCVDTDCAPGNVCEGGKCIPGTGASCSKDGLSSIGKDGAVTSCGAYRCRSDGICNPSCTSSTDCAPGFVCNAGNKSCEGGAADDAGGGCQMGSRSEPSLPLIGLMLGLVSATRRRKRLKTS